MNYAICTKRFDHFQPDREYQYVAETFDNGKEVVDLYDKAISVGTCSVNVIKEYFLKITMKGS